VQSAKSLTIAARWGADRLMMKSFAEHDRTGSTAGDERRGGGRVHEARAQVLKLRGPRHTIRTLHNPAQTKGEYHPCGYREEDASCGPAKLAGTCGHEEKRR